MHYQYHNQLIGNDYPKIQVVCVENIFQGIRNTLPLEALNEPVLKTAEQHSQQENLF